MSSVKLTDAILGNKHGISRMERQYQVLKAESEKLAARMETLRLEIIARETLTESMENLQRLFPKDETITFLVPE